MSNYKNIRIYLTKLSLLLIFIYTGFVLVIPVSVNSTEIYKWTDKKGNIYYSDRPVTANAEKVEVQEGVGTDIEFEKRINKQRRLLEIYNEEREEKEINQAKIKEQQKLRKDNCLLAQKNLANIKTASYLFEDTDDPFNPRVYSDKERADATTKAENKVKQWCR